jgi:adenylate kinase family enzyme
VTFLTGAPGAGKGTNMALIQELLGINHALGLSSELVKNVSARAFVQSGALVPESLVAQTLFNSVFSGNQPARERVIVDGFPRSPSQVCTFRFK